jgi:hypothetical protein
MHLAGFIIRKLVTMRGHVNVISLPSVSVFFKYENLHVVVIDVYTKST